ncbi:pentapeptide repeat-containing protein [Geminicoccaceae bacterium 1502E]|nr:pentapeptide repeat-containing protein [Geminicoccaceae bacterium 1502E]
MKRGRTTTPEPPTAAPVARLAGRLLPALLMAVSVTTAADPARAACSDAAAPGVEWRRCLLDGADLSDTDLSGADLRDTSFKRADLSGANLVQADARRAKFVSARLVGATLDGADFTFGDLTSADLTGASLRNASLRRSKLFRAKLRDADLSGVIMEGADLLYVDLSGATWIDGKTVCAEGSVGRCHAQPQKSSADLGG